MSILRVENLHKHYGGLAALTGVSLAIEPGARQAIIGPNGAGKSTLFNVISGEVRPTSGSVYFNEKDITSIAVHERANLGLGHTFQRNNLFIGLTAFENVRLAVQHRMGLATRFLTDIESFADLTREVQALLDRVGLSSVANKRVGLLAYGQQRALEVALALAGHPNLLLLDEPTAGMSPAETGEMVRLIQSLPRSLTLIIVEHDMDVVFTIADRITVLHYGRILLEGEPEQVRNDPRVTEIYFGEKQPKHGMSEH